MVYTISVSEKPVPHLSDADWKARVWNLRAVAESKTANSCDLRNDVRQTRNEATISRRWANYHNNARISDRLTEIRRWLNILSGALQNLKNNSELLMEEKFQTEKEIEKFCSCLNTLSECKSLRDSKNKENLVNDTVSLEFKMELDSLEATKKYLSQKCFFAWEQNCRLVELINTLENDLAVKVEAAEIDTDALKLDNKSLSSTYKPDIFQLSSKSMPYEAWVEHANFIHLSADNECLTASKLRESITLAREKCRMDYLAQYEATNYALRRKIYETLRLKTEMEYQRKNIFNEMAKLSSELSRISKCKEETIQYLKCAESRMDVRNQRPLNESIRDEAQVGLFDEILLLRRSIEEMDTKIGETKSTYNQMESYVLELDTEIRYQEQSMKVDNEALEIHETLFILTPISQGDKTIEMYNMSKEMPPERPVVR